MSKHTPGPWDFSWQIQPNGCPTVGHKGLMVCMVAHSAKQEDQRETALANAALISAAPDLLEALQNLMAAYSEPDDRICCNGAMCGCQGATKRDMAEHYAKEAIAKATGVTD